jgi:hypothetical protein
LPAPLQARRRVLRSRDEGGWVRFSTTGTGQPCTALTAQPFLTTLAITIHLAQRVTPLSIRLPSPHRKCGSLEVLEAHPAGHRAAAPSCCALGSPRRRHSRRCARSGARTRGVSHSQPSPPPSPLPPSLPPSPPPSLPRSYSSREITQYRTPLGSSPTPPSRRLAAVLWYASSTLQLNHRYLLPSSHPFPPRFRPWALSPHSRSCGGATIYCSQEQTWISLRCGGATSTQTAKCRPTEFRFVQQLRQT